MPESKIPTGMIFVHLERIERLVQMRSLGKLFPDVARAVEISIDEQIAFIRELLPVGPL